VSHNHASPGWYHRNLGERSHPRVLRQEILRFTPVLLHLEQPLDRRQREVRREAVPRTGGKQIEYVDRPDRWDKIIERAGRCSNDSWLSQFR
jgi:hypothetical protein